MLGCHICDIHLSVIFICDIWGCLICDIQQRQFLTHVDESRCEHDSSICAIGCIHMCYARMPYMWHSLICGIHMSHMKTHYMWHPAEVSNDIYGWVMLWTCLIRRCHRMHLYVPNALYTGWRRLIGSPKLQIIFHKRATKYRALLRKMTYKDKGSYESSPPCSKGIQWMSHIRHFAHMNAAKTSYECHMYVVYYNALCVTSSRGIWWHIWTSNVVNMSHW